MTPHTHFYGMAPHTHFYGLGHQATTPAFSAILLGILAVLAVAVLMLRRRAHG